MDTGAAAVPGRRSNPRDVAQVRRVRSLRRGIRQWAESARYDGELRYRTLGSASMVGRAWRGWAASLRWLKEERLALRLMSAAQRRLEPSFAARMRDYAQAVGADVAAKLEHKADAAALDRLRSAVADLATTRAYRHEIEQVPAPSQRGLGTISARDRPCPRSSP